MDIKSSTITTFNMWKRRRLPGEKCGFASIRPLPGHPRQPDPYGAMIGNDVELFVFLDVPHPGQVGLCCPAVVPGINPAQGDVRQGEPP